MTSTPPDLEILPFRKQAASFKAQDPRCQEAAGRLLSALATIHPEAVVEHVGSTAIEGCGGKGILDLMIVCPEGELETVKAGVDAMGFQKQAGGNMFPESRPLRKGAIMHAGVEYRIHLHIIPHGSTEPDDLRFFRDTLRADPELVRTYERFKQQIINSGTKDPLQYSIRKGHWVKEILARR